MTSCDYYDWYTINVEPGRTYYFWSSCDFSAQNNGHGDTYGELFLDSGGVNRVAYDNNSKGNYQFSISYTADSNKCYLRVKTRSTGYFWSGYIHYKYECNSPSTPSNITYPAAASSGTSFTVSWDAVRGVAVYELQRATNSGFSGATTVYNGPSTFYDQSGLGVGSYYYRVRAKNDCGSSGWKAGGAIVVSEAEVRIAGMVRDSSGAGIGGVAIGFGAAGTATTGPSGYHRQTVN